MENEPSPPESAEHSLGDLAVELYDLYRELKKRGPRGLGKLKGSLETSVVYVVERAGRAEICLSSNRRANMLERMIDHLGGIRRIIQCITLPKWRAEVLRLTNAMERLIRKEVHDCDHPVLTAPASDETNATPPIDGPEIDQQELAPDGTGVPRQPVVEDQSKIEKALTRRAQKRARRRSRLKNGSGGRESQQ
jgi:hypothetical protein